MSYSPKTSIDDPSSPKIQELAAWAIQEFNKKHGTLLKYFRAFQAKKQVGAGMMYYIGLEASNGGLMKKFEVKVWVKDWMNWRKLEAFKPLLQGNAQTTIAN